LSRNIRVSGRFSTRAPTPLHGCKERRRNQLPPSLLLLLLLLQQISMTITVA